MDNIGGASPRVATRSGGLGVPHPPVPSLRALLARSDGIPSEVAFPLSINANDSGDDSDMSGLPDLEPALPDDISSRMMGFQAAHGAARRRNNSSHHASSMMGDIWGPPPFAAGLSATGFPPRIGSPPTPPLATGRCPFARAASLTGARESTSSHAGGQHRMATRRSRPSRDVRSDLELAVGPPPPPFFADGPASSTRARKRAPAPSIDSPSPAKKRRRVSSRKPPPPNAKEAPEDDRKPASSNSSESCCICMCEPTREDLAKIDGCNHRFCFECIGKWADRENTCPLCKVRFTKIERVYRQRKKGVSLSRKVKQRDQRADLVAGPALEGLIASIAASGNLPGGARVGRFIFTRTGNGNIMPVPGSGAGRGARGRVTFSMAAESLFESDEEEDRNDMFGGTGFMNSFMQNTLRSAMQHVSQRRRAASGGPFAASVMPAVPSMAVAPSPAARSYATNGNDESAGRAAENPLEIDDDDDSDDDVEVVQVTRSG